MRREAAVEAVSAIEIGVNAADGNWGLDIGDPVSINWSFSEPSGPPADKTGNSASWAAWGTKNMMKQQT